MRRIKRNLIAKARKAYLQEKRTTHTYHGEVDRWAKDLYAGDPDFYKAKVAPLIRQLDSYLPLVTVEMDDATVDKLFHEAVPGWFEIRFKISDLRKDYLEESTEATKDNNSFYHHCHYRADNLHNRLRTWYSRGTSDVDFRRK